LCPLGTAFYPIESSLRPDSAPRNIFTRILTARWLAQDSSVAHLDIKKCGVGVETPCFLKRAAQPALHMPVDGLHSIDI
jgi:hypothetical protein